MTPGGRAAEAALRREQNLLDSYRTGRKEDVTVAERVLAVAQAEPSAP